MKVFFATLAFIGAAPALPALAQDDMTCDSYVQIEGPSNKARPDTGEDPPEAREATKKILEYCTAHPDASVEDAAKAVGK